MAAAVDAQPVIDPRDDLLQRQALLAELAGDPAYQAVHPFDVLRAAEQSARRQGRLAQASFPLSFKASSTDQTLGRLYMRVRNSDSPGLVPASGWEYAGDRAIRLLPAGTPFAIGVLYQFVYPTSNPPVSGIGFAATCDLVSFLRPDTTFPFAYQDETDPFGGKVDGILNRCTARMNCPKVIHTNTGIEYWQSGQSLVTTDPSGKRDGRLPDNVRVYHFAGTQHIMGATMPPGICALPPNTVDPRPVLRALLMATDRWVRDGTPPPPSAYPKLSDRTLVAASAWRFPDIPGVQKPASPARKVRYDYGPEFDKGILGKMLPGVRDGECPVLVPQVDADGNEIGGVRVPVQAVPIATSMGWGVRSAASGTPGELCYLDGSIVPFVRRADQRGDFRDPRQSLAERYGTPEQYALKVRAHAETLRRDGYLLEEDMQRVTAKAGAVRW